MLTIIYLPINQAWALLWYDQILMIDPNKADVKAYKRELVGDNQ